MFTIAGGILIAALVLGVVGMFFVAVSHWFGTSNERASQKKWETEMASKRSS